MTNSLSSRLLVPAVFGLLLLAATGCSTNSQTPINANTAPLPDHSLRPGLNSPDTTNPISGVGGVGGAGPVSPGGFGSASGSASGGSFGGRR